MNKLFICNQSQNRSPTAAKLLGGKFTSLYNDENRLTEELLKEADVVYVFEEIQREEIGNRFPEQYIKKKIINLDIQDIYQYNQPELIKELLEAF
ncbi:phosphotyrosine protein phosphatase [Candidatus Woesearchaeota archaeon]|jgi:predicted protein tyrosine phosphatase|nr:phosphotyrosine protein phosphatase [Candidatus Woesearchaeota archaeon]MBT4334322.1 phosphotyrosine protein phosphatase [archaeon]MBT4835667.1 phosphotyrosine protein phosphatase [Candidatus Woesearchaeota archaeon]MBT7170001.1 phosphotyrosine protein phosphatase [Candidatus Woesearchaeota archaeon]MBT7474742.1 phosphotyrosine protein phosphatase [Candidatus Woesearchaeota archaeon]